MSFLAIAITLLPSTTQGQIGLRADRFPGITFVQIVDIQSAPGMPDKVYVAEQPGTVHVIEDIYGTPSKSLFLDVSDRVTYTAQKGLLGLVFDPGYPANGRFYLHYVSSTHPGANVYAQFTDPAISGEPGPIEDTEFVLLSTPVPFGTHYGGSMAFGPDGMLYLTVGDGDVQNDPNDYAQDIGLLQGKVLRIDVDTTRVTSMPADCGLNTAGDVSTGYRVPPDNLYASVPGACDEIYAMGFRSPWRASFDDTGRLWVADVQQDRQEEINHVRNGGNYGWNAVEGTLCGPGSADYVCMDFDTSCSEIGLTDAPVHVYEHEVPCDLSSLQESITGGYVYTGSSCSLATGKYVYSDYHRTFVAALDPVTMAVDTLLAPGSFLGVATFGLEPNGEVLVGEHFLTARSAIYTINCPDLSADVRVFLEGAYDRADTMRTTLRQGGSIPGTQPYSLAVYDDTPLDYDGTESVAAIPDSAVDWVLVSLRTDPDPASLTARRAALLYMNGSVRDTTGGPVGFPSAPIASYYVTVQHRNHAAVMSASPVDCSSGTCSWDFRMDPVMSYSDGSDAQKSLGDGRWGMFGGNGVPDSDIQALDFNLFLAQTQTGAFGYKSADYNLDRFVQALDFNLYIENTLAGAASQVP